MPEEASMLWQRVMQINGVQYINERRAWKSSPTQHAIFFVLSYFISQTHSLLQLQQRVFVLCCVVFSICLFYCYYCSTGSTCFPGSSYELFKIYFPRFSSLYIDLLREQPIEWVHVFVVLRKRRRLVIISMTNIYWGGTSCLN